MVIPVCPLPLPLLFLQLWVMGLRAADDVKESVRGAAASLVRSLRGISLRIMDVQQSPAAGERVNRWRYRLGWVSAAGRVTATQSNDAAAVVQPQVPACPPQYALCFASAKVLQQLLRQVLPPGSALVVGQCIRRRAVCSQLNRCCCVAAAACRRCWLLQCGAASAGRLPGPGQLSA
jgi:hypothetical protein